jgi:hypothetical protein
MDYLPNDLIILYLDYISGRGKDKSLRLMIVVPDKQTYASEGKQELEGYDENVYHNG